MVSTNNIQIIKSCHDLEQVENKVECYFAVSTKLNAFSIPSKLVIEKSGHTQYHAFSTQTCRDINKKVPNFCCPGKDHKHAVFSLTTGDAAIHVMIRASKLIGSKGQYIGNIRKVFMLCIQKAFEQLVSTQSNAPEDPLSRAINAQLNLEIDQSDWLEFVQNLEICLSTEFEDLDTCFLYYICRDKLAGCVSQTLDEFRRRLGCNHNEENILFYQLNVVSVLTPPEGNAIYADLRIIDNCTSTSYHIDNRYGYFQNMRGLPDYGDVSYISMYNAYYNEKIQLDFCPLTGYSLIGKATAFIISESMTKSSDTRMDDIISNLHDCIQKMSKCIPSRIQAIFTIKKLVDIDAISINLKVNDILTSLARRKILIFCNGFLFTNYVKNIQENLNYAIELYYGLDKPVTKQSLSCLYYAESEFIWSLEKSFGRCNRKRIGDNLSQEIIQDLDECDLKSRMIQRINMTHDIQIVYRNLAITDWGQFPTAVDSDGKINKEYVIFVLYAAFSREYTSLTGYDGVEGTKYCPLHFLQIECCTAHSRKSPLARPVTSNTVAERIIYPVTSVGRVITSLVYEINELNEATVDKIDSFIKANGIDVFPTVLLEGYGNDKSLRCWSPIDNKSVRELVPITPSKFYGESACHLFNESFGDEEEQLNEIEDACCNRCLGIDSSSSFDISSMFVATSTPNEHSYCDESTDIDGNHNGDEQEEHDRCLCEHSSDEEEFDVIGAIIESYGNESREKLCYSLCM